MLLSGRVLRSSCESLTMIDGLLILIEIYVLKKKAYNEICRLSTSMTLYFFLPPKSIMIPYIYLIYQPRYASFSKASGYHAFSCPL